MTEKIDDLPNDIQEQLENIAIANNIDFNKVFKRFCQVCEQYPSIKEIKEKNEKYQKALIRIASLYKPQESDDERTRDFNPKSYGDEIIKHYRIITDNSGDTYVYFKTYGYYDSVNSIKNLESVINKSLCNGVTTYKVNEVINYIKRETYKDILLNELNTHYVCLVNGNFNLKTLKLEEHTPKKFVTYKIPVEYDAKVDTEPIIKLTESLVKGDVALTLQEEVGNFYAQHYINKKLVYAYGPKNSGKSTWYRILQEFLTQANYSNLSLYQLGEKFTNADIYGKRANFCAEIPYKVTIKYYGMIKSFTGGGKDTLTLQKKHKDPFQCTSIAKLFFAGNDIPTIDTEKAGDLESFYLRWQFDNYPNVFDTDETIVAKYTTPEMKSAILKWSLEGYERLREQNWHFTNETSIDEARELFEGAVYRIDSFDEWLSTNCRSSDSFELKADLFRHCRNWHEQQGLETYPINVQVFGKRMLAQRFIPVIDFYPEIGKKQKAAFRGIKLGKQLVEY